MVRAVGLIVTLVLGILAATGLAQSLARPGGIVTGLSAMYEHKGYVEAGGLSPRESSSGPTR